MNPGIVTTGVPAIAKYLVFPFPRLQAKLFGDPDFRSDFLKRSFVDPAIVTDDVIADLSRTSRSEGYLSGMTNLMGQYQDADEIPLLAEVKVPALIVWGAQDRGKPAGEFEQLKGLLPAADTVYVPKSGHYVQEEAPEETAAGMKALADRIMAARAPAPLPQPVAAGTAATG
jgi:pimeloyl-ACP methyl ester carboxylesterase